MIEKFLAVSMKILEAKGPGDQLLEQVLPADGG
jgi:hypothetical protein